MPDLASAIAEALQRLGVRAGDALAVACSAGPDSTALADVAAGRFERVELVHVDHRLRPESAGEGERVRRLAERLGCAARVITVDVDRDVASLEDAARRARYAALDGIAADWILTGHTASDQAETVLMRVLRGTGVAGLAGIPARRGRYLRPMLAVYRADVIQHLKNRGLAWAEDPMNEDPGFTRTRVRHHWMPALRGENPAVEAALVRLAQSAAEQREVLDAAASALLETDPGCAELAAAPSAVAKHALARLATDAGAGELSAAHLTDLYDLVVRPAAGTLALDLPGLRVTREYDRLRFGDHEPAERSLAVRGPDAPYTVRPWRPGDRMRPRRLGGRSRKLSDLYTDAKLPRALRHRARVVIRDLDGEIVWAEHVGPAHGCEIDVTLTRNRPVATNDVT